MVVIANRDNGKWIKISKECFDVLDIAINKEWTRNELIENLENGDDRKYFEQLLNKLIELNVITETGKKYKRIETIYLILTNRCNLQCKHCCVDAEKLSNDKTEEMKTEECKEAINKIIQLNPDCIIISGGEPMIRTDFFELLEYLRANYHGEIILASNATLINRENVNKLVTCIDRIDISIDGVDEDSCSSVRGHGVFLKVLNAISVLHNNGFQKITLSMVFNDFNKHLKTEFEALNKQLGTRPIIRRFIPVGRGEKNIKAFVNRESTNIDINFDESELDEARKNSVCIRCGAGITDFVVDYDGNVYPCANLKDKKYKLFNIKEILDIKKFVDFQIEFSEGFNELKEIQPDNFKKCQDCKINLFCWSCLQDIKLLKDNTVEFEKRCKLKKQILYPVIWG